MTDYRLRNHIPIAGTGNREPADGNESPFRATLGFTPRWFRQRMGIDFSRRWHEEPLYRYETLKVMRDYLYQRFPSIEAFAPDLREGIDYKCATLSGAQGAMIFALIYGQTVHYAAGEWPLTDSKEYFSKEKLSELKPFDPETNPGFLAFSAQMDEIEKRWGMIAGYVNCYQGVLNTAFRLRGQDIFMDMVDDEDFVDQLFDHIYNTSLTVTKLVQARQRKSGFMIDQHSSANCVVNMISPAMYERFVLPYDLKFSQEFPRYGIHTCNWNATPYLNGMRRIPKVGYLDMGMDTDMEKARELFPDARRGVLYSPVKLQTYSLEDIKRDFSEISEKLGPCDIILADVDAEMPDEKMQAVLAAADEIAEKA